VTVLEATKANGHSTQERERQAKALVDRAVKSRILSDYKVAAEPVVATLKNLADEPGSQFFVDDEAGSDASYAFQAVSNDKTRYIGVEVDFEGRLNVSACDGGRTMFLYAEFPYIGRVREKISKGQMPSEFPTDKVSEIARRQLTKWNLCSPTSPAPTS
jgi:hypothetical protein